jgi:hypothetical protein
VLVAVAAASTAFIGWAVSAGLRRATRHAETKERERLSSEVLGPRAEPRDHPRYLVDLIDPSSDLNVITGPPSPAGSGEERDGNAAAPPRDGDAENPKVEESAGRGPQKEPADQPYLSDLPHIVAAAKRDSVYDQLLINDHALGLTQARRAFNVSMVFSILGGIVLSPGNLAGHLPRRYRRPASRRGHHQRGWCTHIRTVPALPWPVSQGAEAPGDPGH